MNEKELVEVRKKMGLYSIDDLCKMFNISRYTIDNAIKQNELRYISPNKRNRYIYLNEFLELMNKKGNCLNVCDTAVTHKQNKMSYEI